MEIRLEKTEQRELKLIKKVFLEAFPREERPPFFLMKQRMKTGRGLCLTIKDGDDFVGFFYLICHKDMAYLFFFAIEKSRRGMGYGGAVMERLQEMYRDKRLFLAREQLDEQADNYDQRVRRHRFYLRSGFVDLPCKIEEGGVVYDVMSNGGQLSAKDYDELIDGWAGWYRKLIRMRVIE